MSQRNVELVREVIHLVNRAASGEEDSRLIELIAPDGQINMSRRIFNPDNYKGHAGVRRLVREMRDVWEGPTITPERFIDAGESVVVFEALRGRGRTSGVAVEHPRSAGIWTVRQGQIVRMELYTNPKEALKAV